MQLYIKNMVCNRCIMAVRTELEAIKAPVKSIELGEVTIDGDLSASQLQQLEESLTRLGFEIINDKRSRLIEQIKNEIIALVHHSGEVLSQNLSFWLAEKMHYDYTYLSNLFSDIEGTTIEKYYIAQRIEKVKELLVYDEMSLSEIADKMGYSSAAYLSSQFKKITGFTPTHYKSIKETKRKKIDEL
ncbi:AraC family transcriptional regulator [Flavobacterium beibuense F44-8]|uniref:AraC family transcriptional regulator n=2 Tax=Flavobacterium beibuense TaxID=657326 RepID=A0A0A2LW85_9FLAO|nr:AraC family transcriptional regulator [Flavobacterium beibuense F44-8]